MSSLFHCCSVVLPPGSAKDPSALHMRAMRRRSSSALGQRDHLMSEYHFSGRFVRALYCNTVSLALTPCSNEVDVKGGREGRHGKRMAYGYGYSKVLIVTRF